MRCLFALVLFACISCAIAQPVEPVLTQARAQKGPLLDT